MVDESKSTGSGNTFVTGPASEPAKVSISNDPVQQLKQQEVDNNKRLQSLDIPPLEHVLSPPSPSVAIDPAMFRRQTSLDIDDYFTGPRDIGKHSKWPLIMQMHGSIIPKLIVPLIFVGGWSTAITVVSIKVHSLSVDSVLLTILGFVVGLSLSFRSSTAYERYAEGRRYWGQLTLASQALGRTFWVHARDPKDGDPREAILEKVSAMNLVVAFSIALKHSLRFEPYSNYPDLQHLIGHLNTFAKDAIIAEPDLPLTRRKNFFKSTGEYLGVSFAASNPRKALKRTTQHLGNLPLEILNHLALTLDHLVDNAQLPVPMQQTVAYNHLTIMNDVMVGCERVLNTPLPIAYTIAISQITFVYVILLPFQLVGKLEWVAIPATIAAAYIIFGLLFIGQEIENPFGMDVNDLPLEIYCDQIANDMDLIAAFDKREASAFIFSNNNMPLYPVSCAPASDWLKRSDEKLRSIIKDKPKTVFEWRRDAMIKKETALAQRKHHIHKEHKDPISDSPEVAGPQPKAVREPAFHDPKIVAGDHNV
ncbi:Bestrophin, RFP-TM, chloride channel-domain-containing protein [Dactylonectria macrodidyma]|uniref:Bestrophin, RFP-TM, chloride channel-domain-containing protein n=1 Tax=Dactylonectria macrodidyma TaxID=307937 RepID=A0A9P9JGY6_9HYPO|nr:Bestrophin, RFP-TM, chloride channel-domain-containing protein [Dactylonectria macrodidyma]